MGLWVRLSCARVFDRAIFRWWVVAALGCVVFASHVGAQPPRPNILFIMGDDHPWPAFGFMAKLERGDAPWDAANPTVAAYKVATSRPDGTEAPFQHPGYPAMDAGSPVNCAAVLAAGYDRTLAEFQDCASADTGTPNFDWLAARGAIFPTGTVSHTRCRESFRSTLTGLYTTQFRDDEDPGIEPKIGHYLSQVGYLTFGFGKIWQRSYESIGFDVGDVIRDEAERRSMDFDPEDPLARRQYRDVVRSGDRSKTRPRKGIGPLGRFFDLYYDPSVYADPATRPPWFVWYSPRLPHGPYSDGKPYVRESKKQFTGKGTSKGPKVLANTRLLDVLLGEIFDRLAAEGELDNTIIIYQSDHGYGLENSKRESGENGFRTVILIAGPGIAPQQVQPHLIHAVDFLPTIMSYACEGIVGVCPSNDDWRGESIRPIVEAGGAPNRLYGFTPRIHPLRLFVHSYDGYRLWRWAQSGGPDMLFDLYNDPDEANDIAAQEPLILQRLVDQMENNFPDILSHYQE